MKITIDSSRVPACEMKIYSNEKLLYEDILFSDAENVITIKESRITNLKIVWNFNLSKTRYMELEKEGEYQSFDRKAKNPPRILSGFDKIFTRLYPDPIDSVFWAEINDIPTEINLLHFVFRGTRFFKRMTLLDAASAELDRNLDICFCRNDDLNGYIEKTKVRRKRYLSLKIMEFFLIFLMGLTLENFYPNFYLLYLLTALALAEMRGITNDKKRSRLFLEKIQGIKRFRETENGIEVIG